MVVNPFIKDSDMTVFRRKLTTLSLFGLLALTAGAAGFGLDSYFEARQQELLTFITSATAVSSGDDLGRLEGKLVYTAGKPTATRVLVDPSLLDREEARLIPVTESMFPQLPANVREPYVIDHGRLVEGGTVLSGKSDPARVGATRLSYRAVAPKESLVVGFMRDGRIVPGETAAYGRIGAYIPGASDLSGALFRDFSTAQVVENPLKLGH